MGKNKGYAKRLKEMEGYDREILAFKLCDEVPKGVEHYGDGISFLCAMVAEVWERKKPFYITKKNVMCGGNVYAGIGQNKMTKEEFDVGMTMVIGPKGGYVTRQAMRRANQQIPHHFKHHKYLIMGPLEDVEDPDLVMIVTDAHRVMRLCKVYTWKTGELVHGLEGVGWCAQSLPGTYRTKTMTHSLGDPTAREFMKLEPGEVCCTIHYELLPLIVENFENISSGEVA